MTFQIFDKMRRAGYLSFMQILQELCKQGQIKEKWASDSHLAWYMCSLVIICLIHTTIKMKIIIRCDGYLDHCNIRSSDTGHSYRDAKFPKRQFSRFCSTCFNAACVYASTGHKHVNAWNQQCLVWWYLHILFYIHYSQFNLNW